MVKIDGYDENKKRISTQRLLEKIYVELEAGETDFEIFAAGQHDIGGPWWNKDGKELNIKVYNPGQRCGSMAMKGTNIVVEGSVSSDLGWLNDGAKIVVKGDSGDTTAHSAAGGKIYVGGRVGTRSGALMKRDPKQAPPELWVLKNMGSFGFEFMGGGIAVVCGYDSDRNSVLGDRACVGMVGGVVYFRGEATNVSKKDVKEFPLNDEDIEFLKNGMDDFLKSIEKEELKDELTNWSEWKKIVAKTYDEKELEHVAEPISKFRKDKWVEGGIFSDVYNDDGNVISLVNRETYRLRKPEWENLKYMSPCNFNCPSNIPTQQRTFYIREGDYKKAVDHILDYSPFPGSVCGYVCPNLCMTECTRKDLDNPIDIKMLGRESMASEPLKVEKENGKKVAVIGGGAGGLSAAWQLRKKGYQVEVFERESKVGGKMSYAIPRERLPGLVLDKELEMIEKSGVKYNTNYDVNEKNFKEIKDSFDAVVLAIGAHDPRVIPIPGHEKLVLGLDFLKKVNRGEKVKVGKKVVVIGAGNAAMDVAWEAYEHGAEEVTCIDVAKPKAFKEEMERIENRGGKIIWPAYTEEITDNGVKLKDGTLLEANTVIISIGEQPNLSFLPDESKTERGMLKIDDEYRVAGLDNVYGVGDTLIPGLLTDAIGSGQQAAVSLDKHLNGKSYEKPKKVMIDKDRISKEYYTAYKNKKSHNKEFDKEEDSDICLSCGRCRDCHMCEDVCPQGAISRIEISDKPGDFEYVSDPEKCIGCSMCAGVCPVGIWHMYPNTITTIEPLGEDEIGD